MQVQKIQYRLSDILFNLNKDPFSFLKIPVVASSYLKTFLTHTIMELAPLLKILCSHLNSWEKKVFIMTCSSSTLNFQTRSQDSWVQTWASHDLQSLRLRERYTSSGDISTQLSISSLPMEGMTTVQRQTQMTKFWLHTWFLKAKIT